MIRIKLLKTEGRWLWIIFLLCIKGRLMDDRSSFLHKTIITRNEGSFNEIDTPHQLMGCVVNQTINLEKCTSLFWVLLCKRPNLKKRFIGPIDTRLSWCKRVVFGVLVQSAICPHHNIILNVCPFHNLQVMIGLFLEFHDTKFLATTKQETLVLKSVTYR